MLFVFYNVLNKTADYIPFVYVCRTYSTAALHVNKANIISSII